VKYTKPKKGKSFCRDWIQLPPAATAIIRYASEPFFLQWLERTTGEQHLLPDPYLFGGGLHRIERGGSLGMHIDFNYHGIGLYRRLNLLLYLNDWREEWGGHLSLAGKKKIAPQANTMVVFTTDDESWHGHPQPLECPEGTFRDSIALYYYSATKPTHNFAEIRAVTKYES
jgi:Rps23 Pro-64 3,4-dihydroxylase Tpa1-like proline 4-hydroxylase